MQHNWRTGPQLWWFATAVCLVPADVLLRCVVPVWGVALLRGFWNSGVGCMCVLPGAADSGSACQQHTCTHRMGLMPCICQLLLWQGLVAHPDVCCEGQQQALLCQGAQELNC